MAPLADFGPGLRVAPPHPWSRRREVLWVFTDMENWAEIRRRVLVDGLSKRAACREYDIHWDTLEKILAHPEPPGYRRTGPRPRPKLDPFLAGHPPDPRGRQEGPQEAAAHRQADLRAAPRRARLHRRPDRRQGGRPRPGAAPRAEVFVPLAHPPGEAQVDFGEAEVTLDGRPDQGRAVFVMTLPYSDAIFVQRLPARVHRGVPGGPRPRPSPSSAACPGGSATTTSRSPWPRSSAAATASSPTSSSGSRATTSSRPTSAWCGGPTRRGTSRRWSATPAATSSSRSPPCTAAWSRSTPELEARLPRRPRRGGCGASRRPRRSCSPRSGRRSCRCRPRRSWPPGSSRRAPTRCRWSASTPTTTRCRREYAHHRVTVVGHGRRASASSSATAWWPSTAGCWGRERVSYDPVHYLALLERKPGALDFAGAAGGLGAAGLLRRPAPPAGGRVRRAGDAAVHQGPAAAGAGEPARS